jgi:hypothetical protein
MNFQFIIGTLLVISALIFLVSNNKEKFQVTQQSPNEHETLHNAETEKYEALKAAIIQLQAAKDEVAAAQQDAAREQAAAKEDEAAAKEDEAAAKEAEAAAKEDEAAQAAAQQAAAREQVAAHAAREAAQVAAHAAREAAQVAAAKEAVAKEAVAREQAAHAAKEAVLEVDIEEDQLPLNINGKQFVVEYYLQSTLKRQVLRFLDGKMDLGVFTYNGLATDNAPEESFDLSKAGPVNWIIPDLSYNVDPHSIWTLQLGVDQIIFSSYNPKKGDTINLFGTEADIVDEITEQIAGFENFKIYATPY